MPPAAIAAAADGECGYGNNSADVLFVGAGGRAACGAAAGARTIFIPCIATSRLAAPAVPAPPTAGSDSGQNQRATPQAAVPRRRNNRFGQGSHRQTFV